MTLTLTVVSLSFFLLSYLPNQLNGVSPCIYDINPKGVIDLTGIGRIDGTPKWKDIEPEKDDQHGIIVFLSILR